MTDLVKTELGYVEAAALAELQDEYDTMAILGCVEKVERLRGELGRLHTELLGLHGMASRIVHGNTHVAVTGSGRDIHEQAEIVDGATFELIELGEEIERVVAPLKDLLTEAVLNRMEDEGIV